MRCKNKCCSNEVKDNKQYCSVSCSNKARIFSSETKEKFSKLYTKELPTDEIVKLFNEGIPLKRIGELHGCSRETISNHLKRTGNWKKRGRAEVENFYTQEKEPDRITNVDKPQNCQHCGRECKNLRSLRQHEIRCKNNPDRIACIGNPISGKIMGWKSGNNYTKAKERGETYVISDETREKLRKASTGKKWSEEQKKEHSNLMKKVVLENPESYSSQNVNGRIKKYEFNGMTFDGKWELKVAECLVNENIEFTNIIEPIEYEFNGNEHSYFPDFYLPDFDLYIEVKGLVREKDPYKWSAVPNLVIFKQTEIKRLDSEKVLDLILELRNKK